MKKALLTLAFLLPLLVFGQAVRIGDILCTDGSTVNPEQFAASGKTAMGIVFYVDNNGQQGWAVNLRNDADDTDWVSPEHYQDGYDIPELPNLTYSRDDLFDLDGYQNTAIIRATHGADWYPAAWSVDFDHGWYLPSAGQLRWLIAYVNEINASIAVANGAPLAHAHPNWYWSSTEQDAMHAIVVSEGGSTANYMKWNYYNTSTIGVRSIRDFSIAKRDRHLIGDVVNTEGGQKGIVYYVSPEDDSYWLVALNDLPQQYAWGGNQDLAELQNYENDWYELHGVHCGYDATLQMRTAQASNPNYAASHLNLDDGWHIPSVGQMSKLFAALPHIEGQLIAEGGVSPSGDYYWTSTERNAQEAWTVNFGGNVYQEGAIRKEGKDNLHPVRPVWSESCGPCTTTEIHIEGTGCDSFTFLGITYDENGHYEQLIESPDGCDTLYSIEVNLGQTVTHEFWQRECESYTWDGTTYDESGDYTQNLTTLHGCDSIVTMHLTIIGTLTHEWAIEACDRYTWNGITYTEPGDYVQELVSPEGCDSIVTMHLSFSDALEVDADTTACGNFTWNGNDFTQSGVIDSTYITPGGCDSLVHLHFSVMPYPETVGPIEGLQEVYVCTDLISGLYHYHIDSVEFATRYEWELEGADWPMDTTGLHCGLRVTSPDDVILRVKAWNSCGYTEREIHIHAGFFDVDESQGIPFAMYPNPAHDKVTIEAEGIIRVRLFDCLGQCLIEMKEIRDQMNINLSRLSSGIYAIETTTVRGRVVRKLNVIR